MGWVLFFDGECAFCSESVRRVARLDRRGRIGFAPLQGRLAGEMGFAKYAEGDGTMVVLRESDGRVFVRSDGWIELARALGGWWRLLMVAGLAPRWLRDGIYRWIARNRRRLGGGKNFCSMPDPEVVERLRE